MEKRFTFEEIKPLLPKSALRLVDYLGFDVAMAFIKAYGGLSFRGRLSLKAFDEIARQFGKENALKFRQLINEVMSKHKGQNTTVYIPRCAFLLERCSDKPPALKPKFVYSDELKPYLPSVALELLEVLGVAEFEKLINHFGGRTIRIDKGKKTKTYREFIAVMSEKAVNDFFFYFQLCEIYIPTCNTAKWIIESKKIVRDYEEMIRQNTHNFTVSALAKKYGYSDRSIQNTLSKITL